MTLTQTAAIVKQVITLSAAALVLAIIGFIGYKIWYAYYLAHLPVALEKPDTKFGLLPAPYFPAAAVSTSNFSYSLDTITGGLPKAGIDPGFEKIIKVYFVTQTFATFLSPERSASLAEKFGINSLPEILTETKYKFSDQNKSLLVDLDTGNFSYTKEASVSGKVNPDDNNNMVADFEQTLGSLGVFKNDLRNSRNKVILLKKVGEKLIPTQIQSEVVAAQISLWPASIDKKPIFTADADKSLISTTVVGRADILDNYLALNFTYYPIDTTTFATYPLKNPEAAFDDLKNGKGVVIVEPDKSQVSITSLNLGYYLPENYSPYLQPIFIFEGPNFMAYVPAVSSEFQSQGH